MNQIFRMLLVVAALTCTSSVAFAQEGDAAAPAAAGFSMDFGRPFAVGLVIIGAGLGISRIGGMAVEGMSRQPEASGGIQTAMIISAALIEGAAFFALILLGFIIVK